MTPSLAAQREGGGGGRRRGGAKDGGGHEHASWTRERGGMYGCGRYAAVCLVGPCIVWQSQTCRDLQWRAHVLRRVDRGRRDPSVPVEYTALRLVRVFPV